MLHVYSRMDSRSDTTEQREKMAYMESSFSAKMRLNALFLCIIIPPRQRVSSAPNCSYSQQRGGWMVVMWTTSWLHVFLQRVKKKKKANDFTLLHFQAFALSKPLSTKFTLQAHLSWSNLIRYNHVFSPGERYKMCVQQIWTSIFYLFFLYTATVFICTSHRQKHSN